MGQRILGLFVLGVSTLLVGCGAGSSSSSQNEMTAPTLMSQPTNQSVTAGQSATFSVVATGTAPLTYQWQKNGSPIAGATSSSYTTPATTPADSGSQFKVVVANPAGSSTSNPATLTVTASATAPSITTQPANQSVTAGQTAAFSVVATGTAPLSYQWQKNGASISGATSSTYTTPSTSTSDNGSQFKVVVTNSAGSVPSNAATLTVTAAPVAPSITTQPENQTVTAGQTASFSVVASGTAPLSYQWQKNGSAISGATSSTYTTPATSTSDNGSQFKVVVTNSVGSTPSNAATLTVTAAPVAPSITTQPANQTVTAGQTASFSVSASGTSPLSYQWQKNGSAISGATSSIYTTPATSTSDTGSQFKVVVTNSVGSTPSNAATLTVNAATSSMDVLTYHNDLARTGQNLTETTLTLSNVASATFGKIGFFTADGLVDAEPLYASSVAVPSNGTHNILIVATEHDSVYAFDADSGSTIWKTSMLKSGETTSDNRSCGQVTPEIGVTSTPVIDRTQGPNGTVYVVAMSKDGSGNYHQRIHALDLALGTEVLGGPVDIQAQYPGTGDGSNGTDVIFAPGQYKERAALLLLNGVVYTSWASHCDDRPYTGWIMGYSATTLSQTTVLNVTPNGNEGAIWMAGAGLAADSSSNIYFLDANGDFDTNLNAQGFPTNGDFGNAFLKLSTNGGLAVADYFEMDNESAENGSDTDLGSGGAMLLPDLTNSSGQTVHLAVGAGKDSNLYVVNRDSMGKYSSSTNNVYQELKHGLPGGVWAMPAYFNNTVYYGSVGSPIKAFGITNAKLGTSAAVQTTTSFPYPGATPSISANGTNNGIVWAVDNNSPAVLHAYNAATLTEIYNSSQASGGRDQFGNGNKFMTPMIVNGKVFVGTPTGVAVFGLLP
jgi:Immunoglobulin domain/Immunoglobulin I-set domain